MNPILKAIKQVCQKKESKMEIANQYVKKANSAFSFLAGGKTDLLMKAAEEYSKCSKQSLVKKEYENAAKAAINGADCYMKIKDPYEAMNLYQSAFTIYLNNLDMIEEAISILENNIENYYIDSGNFSKLGQLYQNIANKLNENEETSDEIIKYYNKAAEMFEASDKHVKDMTQCWNAIAKIYINDKNYKEAAVFFEKSGKEYTKSVLTKFSATGSFMDATLCFIAFDPITAEGKYDVYTQMSPLFEGSREGKFCKAILENVKKEDIQEFTNICFDYDNITKLESWRMTTLLEIKRQLQGTTTAADTLM